MTNRFLPVFPPEPSHVVKRAFFPFRRWNWKWRPLQKKQVNNKSRGKPLYWKSLYHFVLADCYCPCNNRNWFVWELNSEMKEHPTKTSNQSDFSSLLFLCCNTTKWAMRQDSGGGFSLWSWTREETECVVERMLLSQLNLLLFFIAK